MTALAEGCSCSPGRAVTPDTDGRCCWPSQVWAKARQVCVGIPTCPAGFVPQGEDCVRPAEPTESLAPSPWPLPPPPPSAPEPLAPPPVVTVEPLAPPLPPAPVVTVEPLAPPPGPPPETVVESPPPPEQKRPFATEPPRPLPEPTPSSQPAVVVEAAPETRDYSNRRWIFELQLQLDAIGKYSGAGVLVHAPIGTRQVFSFFAGVGLMGGTTTSASGTRTSMLIVPVPLGISYRIGFGFGLQVIPLLELVPHLTKLGSREFFDVKLGGGVKFRVPFGKRRPGANIGVEVLTSLFSGGGITRAFSSGSRFSPNNPALILSLGFSI